MSKRILAYTILFLGMLLVSCADKTDNTSNDGGDGINITSIIVDAPTVETNIATEEEGIAPVSDNEPAYPYPPPVPEVFELDTPYPGAPTPVQTSTPSPEDLQKPALPIPSNDQGAVIGQLLHTEHGSPGSNLIVYLGMKVEANPGPGYLINTFRNSSPHSEANAGGYFIINEVDPGTYALVLGSLVGSRVLQNPETGEEYWVEIVAGEVTDIGEVFFTFP